MSDEVEVVIFGYQNTVLQTRLSFPVSQKQFSVVTDMEDYIPASSDSIHYILVFLDPIDKRLSLIIKEFEQKKQVIKVFMCTNRNNQLIHRQKNVIYISTLLLTYEVTYSIIDFLTAQFPIHYYALGASEARVESLKNKIEIMKSWLTTSNQIDTCHILLTPLNVTIEHLFRTRDLMTMMCNKLCGNQIRIKVFTIYDYIPRKDPNHEQPEHMSSFAYRQLSNISHLLPQFGGIHMVLVGNEKAVLDDFARIIIAKERDNTLQSALNYENRCTLIANDQLEPLSRKVMDEYLPNIETWQLRDRTPKTLEDLEQDPNFKKALFNVHPTLQSKQKTVNAEFQRLLENFFKNALKSYEDGKKSDEADDTPQGIPEGFHDPIYNQIQFDKGQN